jgi:hypothetical protein
MVRRLFLNGSKIELVPKTHMQPPQLRPYPKPFCIARSILPQLALRRLDPPHFRQRGHYWG